jgi:hypothetical protein
MPTDREIADMLDARASRATTTGLLSDARLVALASGRGGIRGAPWMFAPAVVAAVIAVLFTVALVPRWDRGPSPSDTALGGGASMVPTASPSRPRAFTAGAEVICVVEQATCDEAVAILRANVPNVFRKERLVVGEFPTGCPPNGRCAAFVRFRALAVGASRGWSTIADLDLIAVTGGSRPQAAQPIESSTIPIETLRRLPLPSTPSPDGKVAWTVAQLQARPMSPAPVELVLSGWLSATPSIECRNRPVPSGQLDFGCDERDWMTDRKFQPWSEGATREPKEGIRVPNGSYRRFAFAPSNNPESEIEPRFGAYLVRAEVGSGCEFLGPSTSGIPCSGPPAWIVEITDRIAP